MKSRILRFICLYTVLILSFMPLATLVHAQAPLDEEVTPTILPLWWSKVPFSGDVSSEVGFPMRGIQPLQTATFGPSSLPKSLQMHSLQSSYVYTRNVDLFIPVDACVTDTLTVSVSSSQRIADVEVGLNINFPLARGIMTATLHSPEHITVALLTQDYTGLYANYDILLDDESPYPVEDGNDDDIAPPIYDRVVYPPERLSAFDGSTAQGEWMLRVCGNSAPMPGQLNVWSLKLAMRDPAPIYAVPTTYKSAPYKLEEGASGPYVVVITNTGELTGTATLIRDALPAEAVQSGPATYTLESGVTVSAFQATAPITWLGSIPPSRGITLTIPVTLTAATDTLISNTVTITDPQAPTPLSIVADSYIYPASTVYTSESFNTNPGGFKVTAGTWVWGMPHNGPLTCHSQPKCWGNRYAAPSVLTRTLSLPSILPTQTLQLQWWEWLDVAEIGYKALVLLSATSNPTPTPFYGGDISTLGLTHDQRANESTWHEVLYDLTPYASETITLYFYAIPHIPSIKRGWYIDDFAIHIQEAQPNFSASYKAVHTDKVALGDTLSYTLYITNSGYLTSTQGRMLDTLPSGLTVVSTTKQGGGMLDYGDTWVEWTTSPGTPLPPGEAVALTLTTVISPDIACGQALVNTALITDALAKDDISLKSAPTFVYPAVYYAWDFEIDTGGFISNTGGVWAWGQPDITAYPAGPTSAHSGQHVWGTDLAGSYEDDVSILTQTVDLSGITPDTGLVLQWWEWLDAHDEWHQAYVQIASTTHPTPTIVYGQESGGLSDAQRAHERTWYPASVDITDWAGQHVTFTFTLKPDDTALSLGISLFSGWYLDDVSIHADCAHISLAPNESTHVCPGQTTSYVLTARNATKQSNDLTIMGTNHVWPIHISPSTLSLGAGESSTFTVDVIVPWSATMQDVDTLDVVLQGANNALTDTVKLTTLAGPHWVQASPVPTNIIFHGLAAYNETSYLVGGSYEGMPVTPTHKYSPTTDTWYTLAPPPSSETNNLNNVCTGTDGSGDPVIVIFPGEGQSATGIQVYNIAGDTWYTTPYTSPLPASGITAPAIVNDPMYNRCYISGGQDSSGVTHTLYVYNVATGTASSLPAMTTPRYFHAAWYYEDMICAGGGVSEELAGTVSALDSTQCYSIPANTWLSENATLGRLPYPVWGMAHTEKWHDGHAQPWMMGGLQDIFSMLLTAEARTAYWNADTLTWTLDAPLPHPVLLGSADVQQGDIYVVGGAISGAGLEASNFNQRHIQCSAPPHAAWNTWVNGAAWQADISVTVQTSATFLIVESISSSHALTLTKHWDAARLAWNGHHATAGTVITSNNAMTWTLAGGQIATLTHEMRALPSTWTETQLEQSLWLKGAPFDMRAVAVNKLPPDLHIDSYSEAAIYAGERVTFTVLYTNTGGYENDVVIESHIPAATQFITASRSSDWQNADGHLFRWHIGNLAQNDPGQFTVTLAITQNVSAGSVLTITSDIYDHVDQRHDSTIITLHIQCLPLSSVNLYHTHTGTIYTDTVVNLNAHFSPTTATKPYTYTLGFDNGAPSTASTYEDTLPFTYTFVTTGEHNVHISAWNCDAAQAVTDVLTLTAYPPGTCVELSEIAIYGPTTGTHPGMYTFTTSYTPPDASWPVNYTWDNGDTTNSTSRWLGTGNHTLMATATNLCSTVTRTHTVTISSTSTCTPVHGITLTQLLPTTVYTDTIARFNIDLAPDDLGTPYTYTINYGEGASAPSQHSDNPLMFTHTFAMTGTHTITVSVWNCTMPSTVAVIDTLPVNVSSWSTSPPSIYLPLVLRN